MTISKPLLSIAVAAGCLLGTAGATAASAAPAQQPAAADMAPAAVRKYWVTVKTGNLNKADTDANIYVRLRGPLGSSGYLPLNDEKDNFERNAKETFGPFVLHEVGPVRSISLRKNNGDSWYAEYVTVKVHNGPTVACPVNRWYNNPPEWYTFTCG
jgi:hypothetical protein